MNIFSELFFALIKTFNLPFSFSKKIHLSWTLVRLDFLKIFQKKKQNPTTNIFGFQVENYNYRLLDYLIKEVFVGNEYYFEANPQQPILIYDCGANIGMATIYFKWLYPNAMIHSFEPMDSTFQFLKKNVENNHLKDIFLHKLALSNQNGSIEFFGEDTTNLMSSILDQRGLGKKIVVECKKLSDLINQPLDLLKIDVEGAENLIIEDLVNAKKLNKNHIKQIIMEYHHKLPNQKSSLGAFLKVFEDNGYEYQIRGDFKELNNFQDLLIHFY
jgi:FkbM family methyltransferase